MPQGDWRAWTPAQQRRFWNLHLHRGAGYPNLPRQRVNTPLLLHASAQGWATTDDLLDMLIGPRPERGRYSYGNDFPTCRSTPAAP